jgi:hypothetical protein
MGCHHIGIFAQQLQHTAAYGAKAGDSNRESMGHGMHLPPGARRKVKRVAHPSVGLPNASTLSEVIFIERLGPPRARGASENVC